MMTNHAMAGWLRAIARDGGSAGPEILDQAADALSTYRTPEHGSSPAASRMADKLQRDGMARQALRYLLDDCEREVTSSHEDTRRAMALAALLSEFERGVMSTPTVEMVLARDEAA